MSLGGKAFASLMYCRFMVMLNGYAVGGVQTEFDVINFGASTDPSKTSAESALSQQTSTLMSTFLTSFIASTTRSALTKLIVSLACSKSRGTALGL